MANEIVVFSGPWLMEKILESARCKLHDLKTPDVHPEGHVFRPWGSKGKLMTIPTEWTAAERIDVATVLLGVIQKDIYAGRYGESGRPNITSVLHVLHEDPEILNNYRASLEEIVRSETGNGDS